MSGTSYESECPKCGSTMSSYDDWKPYTFSVHECFECGFYVEHDEYRHTLEELNELRIDNGLQPLTALKEQED